MERRALGRCGFDVPVVGMGTWKTFDVRGARDEAHAATIVGRAVDQGSNFFDSSPMYGESERVLGAALDGKRARALVATKIWTTSALEGKRQAEYALQKLGRVSLFELVVECRGLKVDARKYVDLYPVALAVIEPQAFDIAFGEGAHRNEADAPAAAIASPRIGVRSSDVFLQRKAVDRAAFRDDLREIDHAEHQGEEPGP